MSGPAPARPIVESIEGQYLRHKKLAEDAMDQLADEQLTVPSHPDGNSVATVVAHLSGNLVSRFTEFLTSDGEKPWRDRDREFVTRDVSRSELRETWEEAWRVLFASVAELDDAQLHATVSIRGVGLSVHEALHRSLAHTAYHVGQIVLMARVLRGGGWRYLSIPPGGSAAYNQSPIGEKAPTPDPAGRKRPG
jgi:hypothetical protein